MEKSHNTDVIRPPAVGGGDGGSGEPPAAQVTPRVSTEGRCRDTSADTSLSVYG